MTVITNCPVCESQALTPFQICEDFTVSHETFELKACQNCSFLLTSPRPDEKILPTYYESSNYISHAEKATSIFDKVYTIIRGFAVNWKITLIQKHYPSQTNISIFDFGAGTGSFLEQCKKKGWLIAGVEPSSQARAVAQAKLSDAIRKDITEIKGQFKVITLWHVLEHIPNLAEIFTQLSLRLTDDGAMFIAVPNYKSSDAQHYGKYWAGYDVPRHLWHFDKVIMERFTKKHGFKIVETVPMKLDAYYVSMLSETYMAKTRNFSTLIRGLIAGFNSNRQAQKNLEYSSLIYIIKKNA